jgi:hypothetical protein
MLGSDLEGFSLGDFLVPLAFSGAFPLSLLSLSVSWSSIPFCFSGSSAGGMGNGRPEGICERGDIGGEVNGEVIGDTPGELNGVSDFSFGLSNLIDLRSILRGSY